MPRGGAHELQQSLEVVGIPLTAFALLISWSNNTSEQCYLLHVLHVKNLMDEYIWNTSVSVTNTWKK